MNLTTTDPLAPIAEAAIAHMNSDHADAAGLDLCVSGSGRQEIARVAFEPPLTGPEQLRPALVALAERARIRIATPEGVVSPQPERDD
jgi:putative heme iron utilization protein